MLRMITEDHVNDNGLNNVGVCNDDLMTSLDQVRVPKDLRAGVIADCNTEFRLLDSDGNVYYKGVYKDLHVQCDDDAFEPLDHFRVTDGVTMMQYRRAGRDAVWKDLEQC